MTQQYVHNSSNSSSHHNHTSSKNVCAQVNLHNTNKRNYLVPKIGVSGAADIAFLDNSVYDIAKEIGRQISLQGAVMVSGATTGFPYWAAMGCKEQCGISIGLSPAASAKEHVEVYRLPLEYMDMITYTGFGYNGRDLMFVRSCDGVIIGPGRIGTFHEFAIAYEDQKPLGILMGEGEWKTDEIIKSIIEFSHRPNKKVIFDTDPERLVAKLIELIKQDRKHLRIYRNDDNVSVDLVL
jgi:uncharacterized protein (TIGR00725 family)